MPVPNGPEHREAEIPLTDFRGHSGRINTRFFLPAAGIDAKPCGVAVHTTATPKHILNCFKDYIFCASRKVNNLPNIVASLQFAFYLLLPDILLCIVF